MGVPWYLEYELAGSWLLFVPYGLALLFGLVHGLVFDLPVGRQRRFLFDRIARYSLLAALILHTLLLLGRLGLEQHRLGWGQLQSVAQLGRFHLLSLLACLTGWTAFSTQRRHRETPGLFLPGLAITCALLAWCQLDGRLVPADGLGSGLALELAAQLSLACGDALLFGVCCALVVRKLADWSARIGVRSEHNRALSVDRSLADEPRRGLHTGFAALVQGTALALLLFASGVPVPALGARLLVLGLVGLALVNRLEKGLQQTVGRLCIASAALTVAFIRLDLIGM